MQIGSRPSTEESGTGAAKAEVEMKAIVARVLMMMVNFMAHELGRGQSAHSRSTVTQNDYLFFG
jgi:hypothetical protein